MATPNYSYEKRQRELAKKRKAEEKRQKKLHRGENTAPADGQDGAPPSEEGMQMAPPATGDSATES